jgi:hypothetical protein
MQRDKAEQIHQQLWKVQQEEEKMPIITEEVCVRARRRERFSVTVYWIVMSFTALFAIGFVRNLLLLRDLWLTTGTAWALAALCFISWRLVRAGPARMYPAEPCVQFLLRELEGKRQGFLWIRWLVVLLFPAVLLLWWGGGPVLRAKALGVQSPSVLQLLKGPVLPVIMGLLLVFIWFAFSRQARKVGQEIEKLRHDERI